MHPSRLTVIFVAMLATTSSACADLAAQCSRNQGCPSGSTCSEGVCVALSAQEHLQNASNTQVSDPSDALVTFAEIYVR